MKWVPLGCVWAFGLLLLAGCSQPRYQLITGKLTTYTAEPGQTNVFAAAPEDAILRLDTTTGRTWRYVSFIVNGSKYDHWEEVMVGTTPTFK